MTQPPRIKPPSAIDGYRRLARTRSAATPARGSEPGAAVAPQPTGTRTRRARFAGGLRLLGFVGVLAIIIGTSVSLASADTRDADATSGTDSAARSTAPVQAPGRAALERAADAKEQAAADAVVPAVSTTAVTPPSDVATSSSAATPAGTASLPVTGETGVELVLLGGSMLVLFGMLAQIAGQPLPASASSRQRRASRTT